MKSRAIFVNNVAFFDFSLIGITIYFSDTEANLLRNSLNFFYFSEFIAIVHDLIVKCKASIKYMYKFLNTPLI